MMQELYSTDLGTEKHDKEHNKRKANLVELEKELHRTEKEFIERRRANRKLQDELGISIEAPADRNSSGKKRSRSRRRYMQYERTHDFDAEGVEKQLETLRTNISANSLLTERGGTPLVDATQSFNEQQSTALPTLGYEGSFSSRAPQSGLQSTRSRPQYGKENFQNVANTTQRNFRTNNYEQEKTKRLQRDRFIERAADQAEDSQIMYVELQEIKRDLKRVKESERALIEENHKLLDGFDREKKALEEQIIALHIKCREAEMYTKKSELEKIRALEEENSSLRKQLTDRLRADDRENILLREEIKRLEGRLKVGKQKNLELEETIHIIDREYKGLKREEEHSRYSPSRRANPRPSIDLDERRSSPRRHNERSPSERVVRATGELVDEVRKLNAELNVLRDSNQGLSAENHDFRLQLERIRSSSNKSEDILEKKFVALQNETEFWKSKCQLLSDKYYGFLKKLREEKEDIKNAMKAKFDSLKELTERQIEDLHHTYRKKILFLEDRSEYLEGKIEDATKTSRPKKKTNKK